MSLLQQLSLLPPPLLSGPSSSPLCLSSPLPLPLSPQKRVSSSPLSPFCTPPHGQQQQQQGSNKVSRLLEAAKTPHFQQRAPQQLTAAASPHTPLSAATPRTKLQLQLPSTPTAPTTLTPSAHAQPKRINFGGIPTPTTSNASLLLPPPIPSPAMLGGSGSKQQHQQQKESISSPAPVSAAVPLNLMGSGSKPSATTGKGTPSSKRWLGVHSTTASSPPASSSSPHHFFSSTLSPSPVLFDRHSPCPSPTGSGAGSNPPTPSSTADRFIPSRRELPRAVALAQSHANEESYQSERSDAERQKENAGVATTSSTTGPSATAKVDATRALQRAEFQQQLAQTLLSDDGGLGATMLTYTPTERAATPSKGDSAKTKRSVRKVLFPSFDLSSSSVAASSSPVANLPLDYHHNLSTIYRSPGLSAATATQAPAEILSPILAPSPSPTHRRGHTRAQSLGVLNGVNTPSFLERLLSTRAAAIPAEASRILDCPSLANDYYLNLLHWSKNGVLAIALGSALYLWNSQTTQIESLPSLITDETEEGSTEFDVSSLRWSEDGQTLAVGYADSAVRLWDVSQQKVSQHIRGSDVHTARVSTMDWNCAGDKSWMLATGGADSFIHTMDTRCRSISMENVISTYEGHREEVCGLAFSPDGSQLASGANDNKLCIWNLKASLAANRSLTGGNNNNVNLPGSSHLMLRHHNAAVKALAWCPWQERLLASGGGLADGHIRFCNTLTGLQTQAVDTQSQVCSLQWSRTERELLSAHGHPTNALVVWKFPDMSRIATLGGHTARVLHTGISPDGSTVVSAGADETLRFWRVWKPQPVAKKESKDAWIRSSPMHRQIR